jgi:Mg2+ and Co2+ transporter CorA
LLIAPNRKKKAKKMTEELLNIFDQNRKTPLEDKLNQTIDSFENMFNLFLEVTDILDNKLNSLQDQVNSLETRFIKLEQGSIKNKINPTAPPPSPTPTAPPPSPTPTIKKDVPENPRRAVMNELRDLLEKRKQNTDNN